MGSEQFIELHGKSKAIIHRSSNNITLLFDVMNKGNVLLTIPSSCLMYHTLKLHKYYNLLVDIEGVSRVENGKVYTKNLLIVKKVLENAI